MLNHVNYRIHKFKLIQLIMNLFEYFCEVKQCEQG